LVEGSITTPQDEQRIRQVRERSKVLVTIGACATSGGIQALRNFGDVDEFRRAVYASPQYIDTSPHRRRYPPTFQSISSCVDVP
jgi:coenzyme F420-reducing hydrogenase gamma subunit